MIIAMGKCAVGSTTQYIAIHFKTRTRDGTYPLDNHIWIG